MVDSGTDPVNTEESVPSEPTSLSAEATKGTLQPVSETVAPAESLVMQPSPELQTAHMGRIEPFGESEPPMAASVAASPVAPLQASSGKDILVKARATIQDRKHKKLEKILEYVHARNHVTNDEVEKLLHVSDATATRYLSQLEREGKIKQIGNTGKSVAYIQSL